jgi:hypothetical protein
MFFVFPLSSKLPNYSMQQLCLVICHLSCRFYFRYLFLDFVCMYFIQHCFTCRPSDSTVSEDAGIEPRTVATSALAVRRSRHSATSHPHFRYWLRYE